MFVSVDPQRDTVDLIGGYAHYFDPSFVAVTGEEKMINALALQASVMYMKVPGESGNENDYLVDHSSQIVLINPQGEMRAIITPPHLPNQMASDIALLRASL